MSITIWAFVACALSLADIPIFASLCSKDEVIATGFEHGKPGIGIILLVSALLTAF